MRFCLALSVLAICPAAMAADAGVRISSTVRADQRTGRLVRSTVVAPLQVSSRKVAPLLVAPKIVGGSTSESSRPLEIDRIVDEAARTYEVDPLLVHSVIRVESNYNPLAVSPKGAEGLMQLIPATARRFGAANSFDARENITAGVKYLKYLQDMFQDDRLALAAYNAGEGAVQRYKDVPPYRETEQYVYKVGKQYGEARKRQQAAPAAVPVAKAATAPQPEPLRQLEVAADSEGRVILRTR